MNKKPERIIFEMTDIGDVREYKYKGVPLFKTSRHRAFTRRTREEFIDRVAAMQSELELAMTILKRIRDDFHPPRRKEIADFIAKHESDNIPDKGDTMDTDSKMKLEIQQDSDCEILYSLWCNGLKSVGVASYQSQIYKHWEEYISYVASLESRLAELEPLAEVVEFADGEQITISNNPVSGWTAWYWDDNDVKPAPQFPHKGDTFVAALSNCRDKHPEPEEDEASMLLEKLVEELRRTPSTISDRLPLSVMYRLNNAGNFLAREKGDGHAD